MATAKKPTTKSTTKPAKKPVAKKPAAKKTTSAKKVAVSKSKNPKKTTKAEEITLGGDLDAQLSELLAKFDEIVWDEPTVEPIVITKTEHHRVSYFYEFALDLDKLGEIYPDHEVDDLVQLMDDIKTGAVPVEAIFSDAWERGVEIEWNGTGEDAWTFRKGGYDETFEIKND